MIWLSLDPGRTNGWSLWEDDLRIDAGEDKWEELIKRLDHLSRKGLRLIVYERYALRSSAAKSMIGSEFETAQVIGAVKLMGYQLGIKLVGQMPAQKEFFDNERLKKLELYDVGKQHTRDSVRHALYYQYFTAHMRDMKDLI